MRDLLLFRLLARHEHDDERLPGLLDELTLEPLRERAPFFGPLVELAGSERADAELRRRALAALRGATGRLAIETAVRALDDEALALEALCLLAIVAAAEPARWAHVVFHPSAAVRAAGLALSRAGKAPRDWDLCLAADPSLREVVLATLDKEPLDPPGGLPVFVDMVRTGVLPEPAAWKVLSAGPTLAGNAKSTLRHRDPTLVAKFLATAPTGPDFSLLEGTYGEVDTLVSVFPEDAQMKLELALAKAGAAAQDLATAAWLDIRERGPTPSRLQILARFDPASLRSPKLSHADVRIAIDTYLRAGVSGMDGTVDALLAERAMLPDGRVDLRCASAFLRLCDKKPFERLQKAVAAPLLTMALLEEPIEDIVALLSLSDADDVGRREVLGLVPLSHAARTRAEVLATLAARGPQSLCAFVVGEPELSVALKLPEIAALPPERAAALAKSLVERHGADGVVLALELGPPIPSALARAVLEQAALALDTGEFVKALRALEPETLDGVLRTLQPGALLLGKELALAEALRGHAHPGLASWAEARTARPEQAPLPVVGRKRQGVAYESPSAPSVEACLALLGSMDPVAATDEAFARVSSDTAAFSAALDRAMVDAFGPTSESLSPLGHAWLWRWDAHALAHLEHGLVEHGSLAALVRARVALVSSALRVRSVAAVASAVGVLSARERDRYVDLVDDAALEAFVAALATDAALAAATALRYVARARSHDLGATVAAVRLLLPDLGGPVRDVLGPLVDAAGLAPRKNVRVEPKTDEAAIRAVRSATSVEALVRWTKDERTELVHEATLRLVELGEPGLRALIERLVEARGVEGVRPIVESISLWPEGPARARALALSEDAELPSDVRFRLALAGLECRADGAADCAISIACASAEPFFEPRDWEALARAVPQDTLACRLAPSPQSHAYIRAIEHLLAAAPTREATAALRVFLDQGTKRMGTLRRRVASYLHELGDDHGFCLVLGQSFEDTSGRPHLFASASSSLSRLAALTFLAAGNPIAKEAALVHHLGAVSAHVAEEGLEALMTHGTTDKARMTAARLLSTRALRERKLLRIAEVFAWGARIAQRALGKPMRIRMTGTQKLGFTRTRENVLFVTPLPILRGDPHGQEIVAALILHELGHHLYHAGPAAERVWKRAEQTGLHGVFNLVADEHLERNLRAMDARWGDLLKRLAAYAFQHTDRTVPVLRLISHLGGRAFEVLTATRLEPARDDKSVKVDSGSLLFTMERVGLSFARFARALRMGLGNRHADPKVEEALALFATKFRQSSMEELYSITLKLKEIFGFETRLCESIGPHEELEEGGVDGLVWNDGITQEDIDRMIERVVTGEGGTRPSGTGKPSGKLYLNVDPETKFDLIREVRPVAFDPVAYAPYKRKVDRPAAMLRQYLEELGLAHTERRMLVSGRRIDRPRLLPLAIHGDPRAMRSRETKPHRDLYLGLVVDCSGSMATRENIERAKLFGALITEAARPLSEVDVRVFGFTDRVIFDCGPKERCAVHALVAGGGNNDSAALYHVATQAKGSRRKAKVLVMISDGLPTECSVASLKHLVTHLTKREGMIVAQVAVQPISERCFPHYVVLTDASIEVTVRKFGGIIAGLVQKAMSR